MCIFLFGDTLVTTTLLHTQEVVPHIMVGKELFLDVQGTTNVHTQDLCLTGSNVAIKKGYFMRIMRGNVVCWGGYCNLSKPSIYSSAHTGEGAAVCRKCWATQAAIVYDPFAMQQTDDSKKKKKTKVDA
jgi:hypothetical protein